MNKRQLTNTYNREIKRLTAKLRTRSKMNTKPDVIISLDQDIKTAHAIKNHIGNPVLAEIIDKYLTYLKTL